MPRQERLRNLDYAFNRDSVPLLDCERMVSWLQLDEWNQLGAQVDMCLQVEGLGVKFQA